MLPALFSMRLIAVDDFFVDRRSATCWVRQAFSRLTEKGADFEISEAGFEAVGELRVAGSACPGHI
jgi:hypothetical protein